MNDLKPIRTEQDYEWALAELERLWGASAGTPDGDRLDILATLIDVYENRHFPIDPPDPVAAIRFRMEQQDLTVERLDALLGGSSGIGEVLDGRRDLSIELIRRLHAALEISADVLIRPIGSREAA